MLLACRDCGSLTRFTTWFEFPDGPCCLHCQQVRDRLDAASRRKPKPRPRPKRTRHPAEGGSPADAVSPPDDEP
jgi:hypothetical protein